MITGQIMRNPVLEYTPEFDQSNSYILEAIFNQCLLIPCVHSGIMYNDLCKFLLVDRSAWHERSGTYLPFFEGTVKIYMALRNESLVITVCINDRSTRLLSDMQLSNPDFFQIIENNLLKVIDTVQHVK